MSLSGLDISLEGLEALGPAEREKALQELRLVEAAFRANPLLGYRPHVKQMDFHLLPAPPMRCFFGGNRSGKTTATVVDSIVQAIDGVATPDHLKPYKRWSAPFFCRFVTPDLTNTLEGVLHQKLRDWCPPGQLKGGGFDRAYDKQQRVLHFKNGSWFQFLSNDQDRDKFGGAALHRVVFDEEPRQDIRQECLMRLIDYGGEELFGMTPLSGMSWLYDEVYEPWERGELRDGRVVVVDMDDNPHLDQVTKERVLSGMTAEERDARKGGRFVHFAGLIYHEFRRSDHVVPAGGPPSGCEVFCGVDAGLRHPAVVYCFLDFEDRLVVFDEIAPQDKTVDLVCREIKRTNAKWGIRPRWYVIDPAARNKNGQTGRSDQQDFFDHGVPVFPGQNDVAAGINKVKQRLEQRKLFVTANCETLLSEFKRYRWKSEPRSGEDAGRDRPVKRDDHCLDALRYVCMQRPLAPDRRHREPSLTMKDRLLRHSMDQLSRVGRTTNHEFGPGIWV